MRIYLGSDHAGFDLKNHLVTWLAAQGHEPVDCGPHEYDAQDDYPPYVLLAAGKVAEDKDSLDVPVARRRVRPVGVAQFPGRDLPLEAWVGGALDRGHAVPTCRSPRTARSLPTSRGARASPGQAAIAAFARISVVPADRPTHCHHNALSRHSHATRTTPIALRSHVQPIRTAT